jgi:hypothetical protein
MTLPQIFIKETAIILKSAINEEPFTPKLVSATEPVRGISAFPQLLGYVATEPKPRAEIPLVTEKGDPLLAHWQYGLGRTVAFTSDARPKWAQHWTTWAQYQQFWQQVARWSLRRLANADFVATAAIEAGAREAQCGSAGCARGTSRIFSSCRPASLVRPARRN